MQDIAGCRLVVSAITEQDAAVGSLLRHRPAWTIHDRRTRPSYGYRAVHVIAVVQGKPIEIQVRTALQHGWAEFSEALDRAARGDVKYGGGPVEARETLDRLSDIVARLEQGKPLDTEVSPWDLIGTLGMMLIGYRAQRRGGEQ